MNQGQNDKYSTNIYPEELRNPVANSNIKACLLGKLYGIITVTKLAASQFPFLSFSVVIYTSRFLSPLQTAKFDQFSNETSESDKTRGTHQKLEPLITLRFWS